MGGQVGQRGCKGEEVMGQRGIQAGGGMRAGGVPTGKIQSRQHVGCLQATQL